MNNIKQRDYEDAITELAERGSATEAEVFDLVEKFGVTEQQVEADLAETIFELEGEARAFARGQ